MIFITRPSNPQTPPSLSLSLSLSLSFSLNLLRCPSRRSTTWAQAPVLPCLPHPDRFARSLPPPPRSKLSHCAPPVPPVPRCPSTPQPPPPRPPVPRSLPPNQFAPRLVPLSHPPAPIHCVPIPQSTSDKCIKTASPRHGGSLLMSSPACSIRELHAVPGPPGFARPLHPCVGQEKARRQGQRPTDALLPDADAASRPTGAPSNSTERTSGGAGGAPAQEGWRLN